MSDKKYQVNSWRYFVNTKSGRIKNENLTARPSKPKSGTKVFTQLENLQFIELIVENAGALLGNSVPYYEKVSIWKCIADKLNKSVGQCMNRWRQMKRTYNSYGARGLRPDNVSTAEIYQRLKPLHSYIVQNFTEASSTTRDASSASSMHEISNDTSSLSPAPITTAIIKEEDDNISIVSDWMANSLIQQEDTMQSYAPEPQKKIRKMEEKMEPIKDDVGTFAEHVKSALHALPPRLKALAKKDIFEVLTTYEIMNIETQEASQNVMNNAPPETS